MSTEELPPASQPVDEPPRCEEPTPESKKQRRIEVRNPIFGAERRLR